MKQVLLLALAIFALSLFALGLPGRAAAPVISVDASHVTGTITPWMTGGCIEDVNHEIYGGLYDQKLFGESFEEPPPLASFPGWTAYGGTWQPLGEASAQAGMGCEVDAQAGAKLIRDDAPVADVQVDADVKMPAGETGNAGLLVRVQNPGVGADAFDGYEISLSADGQHVILGRHKHDFQPLATAPVNAAPGAWHHLRVRLTGPQIQVFLDGTTTPVLGCTDASPLPAGQIGLRGWLTAASFRNIRVVTNTASTVLSLQAPAWRAISGQWDAVVTGTAQAQFRQDAEDPFNGRVCQQITHGPGAGKVGVANRGLNRWGIAVQKGQKFSSRLYLRAQGLPGPVTVALQSADGRTTYAARTLPKITSAWAKYAFTLTSRTTDPKARFAVWIDRPGILWADQAVLMGTGAEQFHGLPVRADIANLLTAGGTTFLRYGGTMVNVPGYRWKHMIGDPDRRPPYTGNWYPYSTNGFGIFDFLNFCEATHIEAAFAINIEESAQDCADLADYLTAPVSNPWGRRRAADGHRAPYAVQYIEIGNEESLGGDDAAAYQHYAERFRVLAHAIHGRNPRLKLVCAAWWRPGSPNMEPVFRAVDGQAAAWDMHVWADAVRSGDPTAVALAQMRQQFLVWDPATPLKAVIFEENGNLHNFQRALGHATTLNATRRLGDFVLADCAANCLQPWRQNSNGWDQGQIFFTPDHVWAMPPYFVQQMAAREYEPLCVQSEVSGSPDLRVLATRSRDARTLILSVVNTGDEPVTATISLSGFEGVSSSAQVWTLTGPLDAVNPPAGPPHIFPLQSALRVRGTAFAETFPPFSFVSVKLVRHF